MKKIARARVRLIWALGGFLGGCTALDAGPRDAGTGRGSADAAGRPTDGVSATRDGGRVPDAGGGSDAAAAGATGTGGAGGVDAGRLDDASAASGGAAGSDARGADALPGAGGAAGAQGGSGGAAGPTDASPATDVVQGGGADGSAGGGGTGGNGGAGGAGGTSDAAAMTSPMIDAPGAGDDAAGGGSDAPIDAPAPLDDANAPAPDLTLPTGDAPNPSLDLAPPDDAASPVPDAPGGAADLPEAPDLPAPSMDLAPPSLDLSVDLPPDVSPDTGVDASPQVDAGPDTLQLCPPNETLCGTVCVDLQTSSTNCNACGRTCGGGACSAGVCAPTRIGISSNPYMPAVSESGDVYWTNLSNSVYRCRAANIPCTGSPEVVFTQASGSLPVGLGYYKGTLFFADNQNPNAGLYALDASATMGARTAWDVNGEHGSSLALDGDGIFWQGSSSVWQSALGDKNMRVAVMPSSGGALPMQIATDQKHVYHVRPSGEVNACGKGDVCTGSAGNKPPTTLFNLGASADQNRGGSIVSDGTNVLVAHNGSLFLCDIGGCNGNPTRLHTTPDPRIGAAAELGIAVDKQYVYWGSRDGKLYYCSKDGRGCNAPRTLTTGGIINGMLVHDNTWLIYGDARAGAAGVYRVLVPE